MDAKRIEQIVAAMGPKSAVLDKLAEQAKGGNQSALFVLTGTAKRLGI